MSKLGRIFGAIGAVAGTVAQFTPAGAAVTGGLRIGSAAANAAAAKSVPIEPRDAAVAIVAAAMGHLLVATGGAISAEALGALTDEVEKWLLLEGGEDNGRISNE